MATMRKATKRPVTIKSMIDVDAGTARLWAFDNVKGEDIAWFNVNFDIARMHKSLLPYAALDGCKDSIRDAMALGADATLKEKYEAAKERAEYLMSGGADWGQRSRGASESSLLFRALQRYQPERDAAAIKAVIEGAKERAKASGIAWQTAMTKYLQSKQLAAIVAQLREEDATLVTVDTDALFEDLEDDGEDAS